MTSRELEIIKAALEGDIIQQKESINYIRIQQIIPQNYLRDEVLLVATIKGLDFNTIIFEKDDILIIEAKVEDVEFEDNFYIYDIKENKTQIVLDDKLGEIFKRSVVMYIDDYALNSGKLKIKFKSAE